MNQSWRLLLCCLLVCVWLQTVDCTTGGPLLNAGGNPSNFQYSCQAMQPNPGAHGNPQTPAGADGGYGLTISPPMMEVADGFTYEADQVYNIELSGGQAFQGFLVQARVPGNTPDIDTAAMLLGAFTRDEPTSTSMQQLLDCDVTTGAGEQASISHQGTGFTSTAFTWTAPSTAGNVNFFYTVVRVQAVHFDAINARTAGVTFVEPTAAAPTTPPMTTQESTTEAFTGTGTRPAAPTTMAPTTMADTTMAVTVPGSISAPSRGDNQYRLRLFEPPSCVPPACDIFIGIDTNTGDSGYLDVVLEGRVDGWLAVGFSNTSDMFDADVVACNSFGDTITAFDAYNPNSRTSQTDTIQNVRLFSSSHINGILRCVATKRIAPSGGQDIDLNQDLFVIYALRNTPSDSLNVLGTHSGVGQRGASAARFNAFSSSGIIGRDPFDAVHRPNLVRAHGILMIIAWPILAVTAILFAIFMRPALPNGEWFQVHRALMLASLGITAVAFILIFVALQNTGGDIVGSTGLSRAHQIIGILILLLQIINPLVAICRCGPKDDKRWIFNLIHGSLIGFICETLAFVNVAFGLSIFSQLFSSTFEVTRSPLWVWLGFNGFYLVMVVGGVILFAVYACKTGNKACAPSVTKSFVKEKPDNYAVEMQGQSGPDQSEKEEEEAPPKEPSKDSPLRWGWLAVYLAIALPLFLAIIVMVAFP